MRITQVFRKKISKLDLNGLKLIAASLCLSIFIFGFWFGTSDFRPGQNDVNVNNAERLKLLIPGLGTILTISFFVFFINSYVQQKIQDCDRESQQKIRNEIPRVRQKVSQEYRKNQELEFLSVLCGDVGISPGEISLEDFSGFVQSLRVKLGDKFVNIVREYKDKIKNREEALQDLSKGFTRNNQGDAPLFPLIAKACAHAIEEEGNVKYREIPQKLFYSFCNDVHAYLRAWLYCSIKYDVPIPVKPFFQNEIGRETYIRAFRFIQHKIESNDLLVQSLISTVGSQEVISNYLKELEFLLESDDNPSGLDYNASSKETL